MSCDNCGNPYATMMKIGAWTTEAPTTPGWYWAMSHDRYSQPEIVEVIERCGLRALVVDCEGVVDLANFTRWMRIEAPTKGAPNEA